MQAILWDGKKQIAGVLAFNSNCLEFVLTDFSETNLNLSIPYCDIVNIKHSQLYDLYKGGVEITSNDGKRNVLIVDNLQQLMSELYTKIKLNQI